MALVTLKEVLDYAEEKNIAIPGFNIDNLEITQALLMAAEAENCPVIITIGQGCIKIGRLHSLATLVKQMAAESKVPVVLHLDHGVSYEQTIQCLREGFSSVMFDGSRFPLEKNIEITRQVVTAAHAVGVSVEAELGAIGGVEDGIAAAGKNVVDIGEVETMIKSVPIDALAVAIGNAHGIYKTAPKLDFDLLRAIRNLDCHVPHLVLHGGSGLSDEAIQTAISCGIRKINVATEIRLAYINGLKSASASSNIYEYIAAAQEAVVDLARQKIRLFTHIS